MIKNFKIFERNEYEQNVLGCGYYIQEQIPKEGFFDWEYDAYKEDFSEKKIQYSFFYNIDTDDDIIDKVYDFFDNYGIKTEFKYGLHSNAPNLDKQIEIITSVPKKLIIEFGNLQNDTTKYNL